MTIETTTFDNIFYSTLMIIGLLLIVLAINFSRITSSVWSHHLTFKERIGSCILGLIVIIFSILVLFEKQINHKIKIPNFSTDDKAKIRKNIVILSGQKGSAYNLIGEKLSQHLNDSNDIKKDYIITNKETIGSIDNCKLLENKEAVSTDDITVGLFQVAVHKNIPDCNKTDLTYIAPLYHEITHLAIRKQTFDALSKIQEEPNLCLLEKIGLPIYIGLEGSSTKMTANEILKICNIKNKNSFLNEKLKFTEAAEELKKYQGMVKVGFFNQAAKSKLIESLVDTNDICFLPLTVKFSDLKNSLKMEVYTPRSNDSSLQQFYREHTCHLNNSNNEFRSFSSISVIAMRANGAPEEIVNKIIKIIYDKKSGFQDISPSFFDCKQAYNIIKKDLYLFRPLNHRKSWHREARPSLPNHRC